MNTRKLAEKIVDCLSDGYDDEENRDEIENLLYDSLSQISNDNHGYYQEVLEEVKI